jgi:hypothetical protein
MPKFQDITGKRFKKLVATQYIRGKWKCKCDCGNIINVSAGHLNSSSVISCGCYSNLIDISGQLFGFLEVINFFNMYNGNSYWNCKCICGSIIKVSKSNLKAGNVKSCGCRSIELQEQTNLKIYGAKSSFQNKNVREKFKKNNVKKYGVPYPAQNLEISLKTAKSQKNCYIVYHWRTHKELICQALWEKKVVEYFNNNKINFMWKSEVFDVIIDNKKRKYFPDAYLVNNDIWIEIKGYKRELSMKKWNYFHKYIKPNSELWDKNKLKELKIL